MQRIDKEMITDAAVQKSYPIVKVSEIKEEKTI